MKNKFNKFIDCCFSNSVILFMSSILFYISHITLHDDPIIIVGMFIVYLELSKLLYLVATGIDVPIMLRYLMASIVAGMSVKFYIAAIEKDMEWMIIYGCAVFVFIILRWLAIISTSEIRK